MDSDKGKKRFFHASPRRFKMGQILSASRQVKKNYEWCEQGIFVTDKPAAHWTIYEDIKDKGWHLYEVEPMCRMKPFVEDNQCNEWVATQVAIKKYIGVLCGRLGSFISAEKLQKAYPSVSRHKPRFQVFVVPPDDEDLALFDSKTARPFGILSVRLPNKGFDTYRIALDWGKTKANKGDILYIFDRRKTGDLKRIRKEVVE